MKKQEVEKLIEKQKQVLSGKGDWIVEITAKEVNYIIELLDIAKEEELDELEEFFEFDNENRLWIKFTEDGEVALRAAGMSDVVTMYTKSSIQVTAIINHLMNLRDKLLNE